MRKIISIALLASTAISSAAYAEDAGSDIIVTARKTEERLQEVPVSVRVFEEDDLRARSAVRTTDIPGIGSRSATINTELLHVNLHGQLQTDPTMSVDSAVGVYVDGVYVARAYGMNNTLLDIKNVQVLYGPQGTLFGRNSTGGSILFTTNDPKLGASEGSAEVTYGRFNELQGTVIGNLPVTETVAIRLAATGHRRDGFITEKTTGEKINTKESYQVRGKILYEPTDYIRSVLSAEYYESNGKSEPRQLRYAWGSGAANANLPARMDPTDLVSNNISETSRVNFKSISSTTDIGGLKIVAGFRQTQVKQNIDNDGTNLDWGQFSPDLDIKQITADAHYNGTLAGIKYIVGGFYFKEYGRDRMYGIFNNRTANIDWHYTGTNESFGTFANASVPIGRLTVNGGVRFTHDRKHAVTYNQLVNSNLVGVACVYRSSTLSNNCKTEFSTSYDKVTWNAGIDYKISDATMVYAKVATGYRSGGVNPRGVDSQTATPVDPETLIEYQVGAKGNVGDVITYSLSGFYNRGEDVQISTAFFLPFPTNLIRNAAETEAYGGEATVSARLTDAFTLTFNGLLVEPKFIKNIDARTGADLRSNEFNSLVKKQFTIDGRYTIGNVSLNANYVWTDRIANGTQPMDYLVATYGATEGPKIHEALSARRNGILNLRADVRLNDTTDFSVWGRNVTDSRFFRFSSITERSYVSGTVNDPATYGVTLRRKF